MILIYGAGSGLGKSTIVRFIHTTLKENNVPVTWIREEASLELDTFAPYIREVENGRADNDSVLLSACERFIDECAQSESIFVVDSILPCLDWLSSANAPLENIRAFHNRIIHLLERLDPLLISLDRAIETRGEKWARSLAAERCGNENPTSLLAYFRKMRKVSDELLSEWPYDRLDIDTVSRDLKSCQSEISSHILQASSGTGA